MKMYFKDDDTLLICATDSVEAMALKYWLTQYKEQGSELLEVSTDVPIRLPPSSPD